MAKREYDPVETTLIEDAASDALEILNDCAAEWYSMQAQQALHLAGAIMLLKRFAQHELPEHEDANEDDVTLVIGHIDHEHYRHSVRLAKEFLDQE